MKYASLFERLCAHVEIEEHTCCWTWVGPTRRHGGGHRPAICMRVPGGGRAAHPKQHNACRVMCEVIHGPPPFEGAEASHLCDDNWLCISPDHLVWETKQENLKRRDAKLRDERAMDLDVPLAPIGTAARPGTVEAPF